MVISDEMVLGELRPPRPTVCVRAIARREVRFRVRWRECGMKGCTSFENFCIVQGDSLRVVASVYDQSRDEVDIQDVDSIRWWLARSVRHEPVIRKGGVHGGINLGGPNVFYFDLFPAETAPLAPGNYYHEAEVITRSGHVYTVMMGNLQVRPQLIT